MKKLRGNCYVTCEALYHLFGGLNSEWKPMNMKHEGDSHWFLKHKSGIIIDPTASQFNNTPDYSLARGRGFLTKEPSKRAKKMMEIMVWSNT